MIFLISKPDGENKFYLKIARKFIFCQNYIKIDCCQPSLKVTDVHTITIKNFQSL